MAEEPPTKPIELLDRITLLKRERRRAAVDDLGETAGGLGCLAVIVLLSAAIFGFPFSCGDIFDRYAAEVGHYDGSEIKWESWGDFSSLDDCRAAAIGLYNRYYRDGRAYTWSCLLKNGNGGYVSRHR